MGRHGNAVKLSAAASSVRRWYGSMRIGQLGVPATALTLFDAEGDPECRLVREVLSELALPVRCPTMPCFGGADLRTLYITTAREKRPEAELQVQPWAGCVLSLRVDVPGLPVNFARL